MFPVLGPGLAFPACTTTEPELGLTRSVCEFIKSDDEDPRLFAPLDLISIAGTAPWDGIGERQRGINERREPESGSAEGLIASFDDERRD